MSDSGAGGPVVKKRVAALPAGATFYVPAPVGAWCRSRGQPYREFASSRELSLSFNSLVRDDPTLNVALKSHSPAMFVGCVTNARLVPHEGFVCTPDQHILYEALAYKDSNPKEGLGRFCIGVDKTGRCVMVLPDHSPRVGENCVFIGGNKNFGHFIIQNLLRVALLKDLPEVRDLPIAVYDGLPQRYLQFLDLLGYPATRRITIAADVPTRFDNVWLLSSPMYRQRDESAQIWPPAVEKLRSALAQSTRSGDKRPRLFLSRANAQWRRLVNEPDILATCAKFGVIPVDLGSLAAKDQVAAIGNAEIVVCPAGASSQVTAFAPPDCAVIELFPPDVVAFFGPRAFAAMSAQPYARVVGQTASADDTAAAGLPALLSTNKYDQDYIVASAAVERVLAAADQLSAARSNAVQ